LAKLDAAEAVWAVEKHIHEIQKDTGNEANNALDRRATLSPQKVRDSQGEFYNDQLKGSSVHHSIPDTKCNEWHRSNDQVLELNLPSRLPSMEQLQAAVNWKRTQQMPNEKIQTSAQKRTRESTVNPLLQACNASPHQSICAEVLGLQTKCRRTGSDSAGVDTAFSYHDSKAPIEGMAALPSSHTGPSSHARSTDTCGSSIALSGSETSDRQSHQHHYYGHNIAYTRFGQNDVSGSYNQAASANIMQTSNSSLAIALGLNGTAQPYHIFY